MSHTESRIRTSFVLSLALTMMLGPLSLDAYLPAFPEIAATFGTTTQQVALSISVYVFSLAIGQILGGALSDRYGRKPILLSGLVVYAASCLALAFTTSLEVFLALRVVQAVGAGWTFVSIPALVRDRVQGVEAAKLFSLLGLIIVIAPAVAPALGSLLLSVGSWSSIFFFLASYAALSIPLLLVNVFRGEPLLRKPKWLDEPSVSALARYMGVLKHKPARYFIAWQVSAFSVLMLFVTHASFLYQEHFGQSDGMFSLLFGANIVAMFCINLTNRALLSRMEPLRLLQMATALQGFGVVMLVVAALFHWPVYLFVPAMMLAVGSMGAISPNLQACYMEHFPSAGGSAAAVLGAAQFGLAGALSALSALLPHTALAIVLAMAGCASVAVALLVHSRRDASVPLMLVPSPMAQQR